MQAYINSIKCLGVTVETVYMCLSICNDLCFRHKGELCMKTYGRMGALLPTQTSFTPANEQLKFS